MNIKNSSVELQETWGDFAEAGRLTFCLEGGSSEVPELNRL